MAGPLRRALCLIARDAEAVLPRLFRSLRAALPDLAEVVVVDTGEGGSARVAHETLRHDRFAGVVILDVQGSAQRPEWFLGGNGRGGGSGDGGGGAAPILGQFGAARQHAFALATAEWRGWLDCDDVWPDDAAARAWIEAPARAEAAVDAIVMPYLYAVTQDKRPVLQLRERWLRWRTTRAGAPLWRWTGRVHEVPVRQEPAGPETIQALTAPVLIHMHEMDDGHFAASRVRNRAILARQAVEDPPPEADRARAYLALDAVLDARLDAARALLVPVLAGGRGEGAGVDATVKRAIARVRDATRAQSVRSIAIFAVGGPIPWHARSPEEEGCGGSEEAVVYLARELAARGVGVSVFGAARRERRDGVDWQLEADWDPAHAHPLVIVWRYAMSRRVLRSGQRAILWAHDTDVGACDREDLASYAAIWTLSAFQERCLRAAYPGAVLPPFWRLGHALPDSAWAGEGERGAPRDARKAIYCSSPNRGLDRLLEMWPEVRAAVPGALLPVFYGWETFDAVWASKPDSDAKRAARTLRELIEAQVESLRSHGVTWRGRVPQPILARELASAGVWAYPTSFEEVFCLSAPRAEAAGCAIVATDSGSLPEVVTWPDALVPLGAAREWGAAQRAMFLARLIEALTEPPSEEDRRALSEATRRWHRGRCAEALIAKLAPREAPAPPPLLDVADLNRLGR